MTWGGAGRRLAVIVAAGGLVLAAPVRAGLWGSSELARATVAEHPQWTAMMERLAAGCAAETEPTAFECVAPAATTPPTAALLARVDAEMNRMPYVTDAANWGVEDHWSTPAEFLARGGDCEDYAIAKYLRLRSEGVADGAMRVVVVWDDVRRQPHAVLEVAVDGRRVILDNQAPGPRDAADVTGYRPIWSINATAWWLHTTGAEAAVPAAGR